MSLFVVLPVAVPLLVAAVTAYVRGGRAVVQLRRFAGVAASAAVLGSGVALAAVVLSGDVPTALGGQLRADALSAFMVSLIGAVGLTATWGGLVSPDTDPGRTYPTLVALFLGAMALATVADNLGVLWVAVEATTIATAFLVGHHRDRLALEAAWKYVVLGSVGVAIAFLGIVLLYAATLSAGTATLSWTELSRGVPGLDPDLVRVATALAILGFATKAGLAPMHSWLPDAHSQAPAPVSGLMSGVLLSVALYAILRVQAVADPVVGAGLTRWLLGVAGLLSLTIAALLILRQRDLKRMLAYSSIEHMGLMAIAAAVGGELAITALLLHMLGHGLAKSSTFVVSGRVLATEGTTKIREIRTLLARRPAVAVPLLAGTTALLGLPPFSLFLTEVAIVTAGVRQGLGWTMALTVLLLLVVFGGVARNTAAMVFGGTGPEATFDQTVRGPRSFGPQLPILLALVATVVVGFATGPFADLLRQAAMALGGAR